MIRIDLAFKDRTNVNIVITGLMREAERLTAFTRRADYTPDEKQQFADEAKVLQNVASAVEAKSRGQGTSHAE